MTNISQSLIEWYLHNKRDLPWRETKNPYYVWISEIILQQTRVNQGISYYYKFIDKYPSLESLASTHIDELLKVWQGLGYYSRARNMLFTAKYLVKNNNGKFYSNYNDLIKLKGIGDYTASAIASICFNHPTPVLDGNVFRVISRVFGIAESIQKKSGVNKFKEILNHLIKDKTPGLFNQSIMEFGALQCVPKNPDCLGCPFSSLCFAYTKNLVSELPVKKQKQVQRTRYFNYLHIIFKDRFFIEKRSDNDIWNSLFQLPLIETEKETSLKELKNNKFWIRIFKDLNPKIHKKVFIQKHILSHQIIIAHFYKIEIQNTTELLTNKYLLIQPSELENRSVPRLIDKYFEFINK